MFGAAQEEGYMCVTRSHCCYKEEGLSGISNYGSTICLQDSMLLLEEKFDILDKHSDHSWVSSHMVQNLK